MREEELTIAEIVKFAEIMNVSLEKVIVYAAHNTFAIVLLDELGVRMFNTAMIRETLRDGK